MKLNDADAIYVGSSAADAVYLGNALVWSAGAPSCTITLTGDIGPAFGFAAADVTGGNSFSVTDAAANVYLSSTPFATAGVRRPLPAAGKKAWFQGDSFYTSGGSGTNARAGFGAFDSGGNLLAIAYLRGGTVDGPGEEGFIGNVVVESPTGTVLAEASIPGITGALAEYVSFGIDDSGELYIYLPDLPGVYPLSNYDPNFTGVLAGVETIILMGVCDLSGGGPASAGGRIVTNQADMIDRAALVGDEDWCGNPIGAAFNPDSLLAGVTNSFWADPLAGTLFEDAGLTDAADTTADPIGGVQNQSSIGTATLSQATTADKFKVASDGRMERDGTVTTQHLDFGSLNINLTNGFCVAFDADCGALGTAPHFIGSNDAINRFSIYKTLANDLSFNIGGTTVFSVSGAFDSPRKRIVVTGDNVDFEVFLDGVSAGTFSTQGGQTAFSLFILGLRSTAITNSASWKCGNILAAEKDLRANIAQIDAWLEG